MVFCIPWFGISGYNRAGAKTEEILYYKINTNFLFRKQRQGQTGLLTIRAKW